MLIHPWDSSLDPTEWQEWLARTDRFGVLTVNNLDPPRRRCWCRRPSGPAPLDRRR